MSHAECKLLLLPGSNPCAGRGTLLLSLSQFSQGAPTMPDHLHAGPSAWLRITKLCWWRVRTLAVRGLLACPPSLFAAIAAYWLLFS